ncbi:hypothetical protein EDD18DRAFT_1146486 [Armillaria luteobubalina]|uniref:F-box domain-containing protein n=1 Tax=Armillaria luteobubalina TaxID=153913 RepID=A0AA39QF40_9AGAR|nr:hypothetical protein EDD18DRAFT_1146486 [Armillaria luteobubalina]
MSTFPTEKHSETDSPSCPVHKRIKMASSNGHEMVCRQTSTRRVVNLKRRAKLSMLPTLPLDILFEIFGHLHPLDLLHLTRTTKEFRRVLSHRSSMTVWKSSLANVPRLPMCPEDMSHPAWISLVFDHFCHKCLAPNIRNVDWCLRVRLCSKCAKTCLLSESGFDDSNKSDKIILRSVPFHSWPGRHPKEKFCFVKEKDAFVKAFNACQGKDARKEFLGKRKAGVKARKDHAKKCTEWAGSVSESRSKELDDIRKQRSKAIETRLTSLGHGKEIAYLKDLEKSGSWSVRRELTLFSDQFEVKQPKPLTDRNWNSMEGTMLGYMQDVKTHRLKKERTELLSARRSLIAAEWRSCRSPPDQFQPGLLDVWLWEEMKYFIDLPSCIVVTPEMVKDVMTMRLPAFITSWCNIKYIRLLSMLDYEIRGAHLDLMKDLQLATCVFACTDRRGLHHDMVKAGYDATACSMWFPEYLRHPCNARCTVFDESDEDRIGKGVCDHSELALTHDSETRITRRREWSTDSLVFDYKASRVVRKILNTCNLDVNITVEELDKVDPRVVCLKCSFGAKCDGERIFPILTWRTAVHHCMRKHWGDSAVVWQQISNEEAAVVRELEKKEPEKRGVQPKDRKDWRCSACTGTSLDHGLLTLVDIKTHLANEHDKDTPVEGMDYFRTLDWPPEQPLVARMIPKAVTPE